MLVIGLGAVGFAAVGTLYAGLTVRLRAREVLLPLLLPVVAPLLLAAVSATTVLLAGTRSASYAHGSSSWPAGGVAAGRTTAWPGAGSRRWWPGARGRSAGGRVPPRPFALLVVPPTSTRASRSDHVPPRRHRMAGVPLVRGHRPGIDLVAHPARPAGRCRRPGGAEVGVLFTASTIWAGMMWGRPVWGTFWDWGDPRLTTTAVMLAMYVGYLLLRRLTDEPARRATRAAIVGVMAAINIPIVHFSVIWWRASTRGRPSGRRRPSSTRLRPGSSWPHCSSCWRRSALPGCG